MNAVLMLSKITHLSTTVAVSLVSLHLTIQFARFFLDISTNNLISRFLNEFHLERNILTYPATVLFCSLVLFQTVEETSDTGILVFICALTAYITSELSGVRLIAPSRQELL